MLNCFYSGRFWADVTCLWCSYHQSSLLQHQSVPISWSVRMFRREILEATRALCSAGGALALGDLYLKLQRSFETSREDFLFIMDGCSRFLLVPGPEEVFGEQWGGCTVVARTSLRLCGAYGHGECAEEQDCQQLHLCRFFIYGNCRFGKGRWAAFILRGLFFGLLRRGGQMTQKRNLRK